MTPTTPSNQNLSGFLTNLIALAAALPITHLSKKERRALGPDLFARARELTDEVALILRLRPAEFPDQPTAAEEIAAHQQAADVYLELHHSFRYLAEVCLSSHQHHQGQAVQHSKKVLRSVLGGARHPEYAPHLRHDRRVSLLTPAFEVLFGFRRPRRKDGAKAEAQDKDQDKDKAPAAQGKQKAKARQASAARRGRLADLFGSLIPRG